MKNRYFKPLILGALLFVVYASYSNHFSDEKGTISLEVLNTESNDGQLIVYLHNNPKDYPKNKDKAFKVIKTKITNNKATIKFDNIPYGKYAIAVHHDENGDGKVDKNFVGMPSEDFAASNNATGFMGPPSFEDASFELNKTSISIKIDMD